VKKQLFAACTLFLALLVPVSARAQCVNTAQPSCGVYNTCFAKLCPCDQSPYEYFNSYGKKYCEVFLQSSALSKAGVAWRDSTLHCLQEKIVPLLPPDGQAASCNCGSMQQQAFDTHVACYTQPKNSICDLPDSDWAVIFNAAGGVRSLVDAKSRKQIVEVARICLPKVNDALKARIRKFINDMT
jgi:hypothetical protein